MKLILTRHGETIENKKGIHQGHLPGTLSKKGSEQAKKLALRLKNKKIDVIYSSDLARAADTAKEIIKFHPHTPIYFVKGLRERYSGEFQGKKSSELDWDNQPEDAETYQDIQNRAKKILDKAYKKYSDSTVLFVGHGGINNSIITVIQNSPQLI